MQKKQGNVQTISWFYDLYKRELLDLNPPYQRKSVWNQKYKDYFIDTVLLNYPCPPIFLFEEIDEKGVANYSVVDGKQRLTTIFEFIDCKYPVFQQSTKPEFTGKLFSEFGSDEKVRFYSYNISVEYLPTNDDTIIKDIFQRLNKNIAKLTAQELRHARYDGIFINDTEELNDWMSEQLVDNIPKFTRTSINKMKDVEFTAQLLLIIDDEVKGYVPYDLDKAFNDRDIEWENRETVIPKFKKIITYVKEIIDNNSELKNSRLKNQADFYGLYGALSTVIEDKIDLNTTSKKLLEFYNIVDDEKLRSKDKNAQKYFITVRTNTNKTVVRNDRIKILKEILFKQ